MANRTQLARRKRLLSLLPTIYTAQPDHSAVGVLIDSMALVLSQFDSDAEQVMKEHWINFASGESVEANLPSSLESLGRLLEIRRLSGEDEQAFRHRIVETAKILTTGLTSPEAILKLILACLGTEPCSRIDRIDDATIAYGMPIGTVKKCPGCESDSGDESCPHENNRKLSVWLIDNPLVYTQSEILAVHNLKFQVVSPSLHTDMPVIRIEANNTTIHFPSLRNQSTNETIFYAGDLEKGDRLAIYPPITAEEVEPFLSYDAIGHHSWREHYPEGYAELINADGSVTDVSKQLYYFSSVSFESDDVKPGETRSVFAGPDEFEPRFSAMRFSDSTFDNAHFFKEGEFKDTFSSFEQLFDTPRISRGTDTWVYQTFTRNDLFSVDGSEAKDVLEIAPIKPDSATSQAKIMLSWWRRPPATFRIHIPHTQEVNEAAKRGALELIYRNVQRARAAGISGLINTCIPTLRETNHLSDSLFIKLRTSGRENNILLDQYPSINSQRLRTETNSLGEVSASFSGVFDTTRLDWSHFD